MKPIYYAAQVRAAELAQGEELTSGRLMARAASGLVDQITAELHDLGLKLRGAKLLFAVGPGDNGGDGLFAAAALAQRGAIVWVWRTADKVHSAGWAALTASGGLAADAIHAIKLLPKMDLVVDAVFGIGTDPGRALPEPVALFAQACADLALPLVAVDLPSGLSADSPVAGVSFKASRTVSFGAWKPCQILQPARSRCGARHLIDLGLELPTPDLIEYELADLAADWPWPTPESDKYSRGSVGFDTGSAAYPGAAVLGVLGASYSGAGYVKYLGPATAAVLAAAPNVVCPDPEEQAVAWPGLQLTEFARTLNALTKVKADAWVIGSGWGGRPDPLGRLRAVLGQGMPVVVDADALPAVAELAAQSPLPGVALLTPHAGELARLLDCTRQEVVDDPVAKVRQAADLTGATVLLKGASQYVATPGGGPVHVGFPGPHWTAQAGSGDVLAGICGTLLAAGLPPWRAALAAASIQALAATRHPGPYPPQILAGFLPEAIASLV